METLPFEIQRAIWKYVYLENLRIYAKWKILEKGDDIKYWRKSLDSNRDAGSWLGVICTKDYLRRSEKKKKTWESILFKAQKLYFV